MKAAKLVDSFSPAYSFNERKLMGIESVDRVIKRLMEGRTYEGIEKTFDNLNKLKKEINEL